MKWVAKAAAAAAEEMVQQLASLESNGETEVTLKVAREASE